MKNQDIDKNQAEENIREFRLETSPVITYLQAIFYTLGIVIFIRMFFNQNFWGTEGDGLVFAIGALVALAFVYFRLSTNKKQKKEV